MKINTIMVVDDSPGDQLIAEFVIQKYDPDIHILKAYDGEEALEILQLPESQPDIIFLDLNMPRMDGHQFLKEYHALDIEKNVVVAMLTSSSQDEDKRKALAFSTVKLYLSKPLDTKHIEEVVALI